MVFFLECPAWSVPSRLPHVDWLDRLAFAEVERISQREKQGSNSLFLMVEFPEIRLQEITLSLP